jgi:transglutaminase-like putative cysteine protease
MRTASTDARLRVGCEFRFDVPAPVAAVFQVEPRDEPRQRVVQQAMSFEPDDQSTAYDDSFGNRCTRLALQPGPFRLRYDATFEVPRLPDDTDLEAPEVPVADLPDEVLAFLMPSRFCLSDVLFHEAMERFGDLTPGWRRVQSIVESVHGHLAFGYGTSSPTYTAADAFDSGKGVCRDFAHLAISFCRALNIPARYVFGYLPDLDVPPDPAPMDFAAWMEVWLGDRWWTFDPRNNQHRLGRVVIGRGRDAVDVAMVTTYGAATLEGMTVWADEVQP